MVEADSTRSTSSGRPQHGQIGSESRTSTAGPVAESGGGAARKVKGPRPGLRPGRLGWAACRSLENGAAWRCERRRACSSWALREAFSLSRSSTASFKAATWSTNWAMASSRGLIPRVNSSKIVLILGGHNIRGRRSQEGR